MTQKYILQSTRPGGRKFEILAYDPETKKGKLRGQYGAIFEEDMSKEFLKKYGYKVVPADPAEPE